MADLVEALRQRRNSLDVSNETVDSIAGLPDRYTAKLLAPRAPRNLSYTNLGLVMGALGVAIELVDDQEQIERVSGRWTKRKPQGKHPREALSCVVAQEESLQGEIRLDKCQEKDRTMSTENFTMRVEPEFKQSLKQAARDARRTPSDFARLAIEDAIKAKDAKQGEAA